MHSAHKIKSDKIVMTTQEMWDKGKYESIIGGACDRLVNRFIDSDTPYFSEQILIVRFNRKASKDEILICLKNANLRPINFIELLAFGTERIRFVKYEKPPKFLRTHKNFHILALGSVDASGFIPFLVEIHDKRGIDTVDFEYSFRFSPYHLFGVTFA